MSILALVAYAVLIGAVACGVGAVLFLLDWWTYDDAAGSNVDRHDFGGRDRRDDMDSEG